MTRSEFKKEITPVAKYPHWQESVFSVFSALSSKHQAINLAQGFPDFDPPQGLIDRFIHYLKHSSHQYAPMSGRVNLCAAIQKKIEKLYDTKYDLGSEITVTSGATEALFCAIQAIVRRGDEVIFFDPAFDSYAPAVDVAGGTCKRVPLDLSSLSFNLQALKKSISDKTKLIILNTPHNPSGFLLKKEDYEELTNIIKNKQIYILSDEVYEHITFDNKKHYSVMEFPLLKEKSFAVFSFGKTYHATGWKIGYCVAPEKLMKEFRKIHQFVVFSTLGPVQAALADFINECPNHYESLPSFYQEKRDLFELLMSESKFDLLKTEGSYFQLADYSKISNLDDISFCKHMLTKYKVAAIPLSPFYKEFPHNQKIIRFCFAKEEKTLKNACALLRQIPIN